MPTGSLDRYGLTSNPFRELASESVEDLEVFHVNLALDEALRIFKEEALEGENRALIALVGGYGVGKTERLRLAASEARQRNATAIYVDSPSTVAGLLSSIAETMLSERKRAKKAGLFSTPAWHRQLVSLGSGKTAIDPVVAGRLVGQALNENPPAFLLLNDVHNLAAAPEAILFSKMLQETADTIRPGVLCAIGCYPAYLEALMKARPALGTRINRTFPIPGMSVEEAGLLLAKKMLAKRLVDELDPLYPFDRESVAQLNVSAQGNPRLLLELADVALEWGATHRSYRVDTEVVRAAMATRKSSATAPTARPASVVPVAPGSPGPSTPRAPPPAARSGQLP